MTKKLGPGVLDDPNEFSMRRQPEHTNIDLTSNLKPASPLVVAIVVLFQDYHGPPPFGSPHPLGQQKNSLPTKNPPISPLRISANFEAIRKLKQANNRELTGVLLH